MKKIKIIIYTLLMSLLLTACTKGKVNSKWGSSCHIYLENLPSEFELLSEDIRENISISIRLRNMSSDKYEKVTLTSKNDFEDKIGLIPGDYEVASVYLSNSKLAMFDVDSEVKTIKVEKNLESKVPIKLTNPEEFIKDMNRNTPLAEILNEDLFSRKLQYMGVILDINKIKDIVKFSITNDKTLRPAETFRIPSTSHSGIAMLVQNKTSGNIQASEATYSGLEFFNNNVVLPKGITMGMGIKEILHSKSGILGKPDYFLGTPLIGIGYDDAEFIYLDEKSGDRITFHIGPYDRFINSIVYEFEKYE